MCRSLYVFIIKSFFDFIFSFLLLAILSPLFLIITIIQLITFGHPIFFLQYRSGKNGKPFKIIKFRTMNNNKDKSGNLLPDEKRITKFGYLLRVTSLDELPNLLNVFTGKMSIVGPRPLLIEYNNLYSSDQIKRISVKPGITGLAQINGRNSISWQSKFSFDIYYVENISFILDLKIILLTFIKILFFFKKKNIRDSEKIMEGFNGKN